MAYPFPFECEPFYMRPFLIVKSITGVFFTILINFVIPVAVALAILFVIGLVLFAILAVVFGWGPDSEEIKAKREKEKKEREPKERDHKENQNQGKPDAELFTAPLPATASGPGGTYNLEKRLEIELELLEEMVAARRERLAALRMTHSGDEAEYLQVLEKLE